MYRFARSRKSPLKTLQMRKGRLPDQKQASLFEPNLHQIMHPAHELVLLAEKIEAFSFKFFRTLWQFLVHCLLQSQAFCTVSGHVNPGFLIDTGR